MWPHGRLMGFSIDFVGFLFCQCKYWQRLHTKWAMSWTLILEIERKKKWSNLWGTFGIHYNIRNREEYFFIRFNLIQKTRLVIIIPSPNAILASEKCQLDLVKFIYRTKIISGALLMRVTTTERKVKKRKRLKNKGTNNWDLCANSHNFTMTTLWCNVKVH